MVLAKASPGVVLLTGGGTLNLPVTVYVWATSSCPSPTNVIISANVTCTPGPNGTGTFNSAVVGLGFNNYTIPISIPAGPPRICTITATATVSFADGSSAAASGDTIVCIVDPDTTNPQVPRLDMALLDDPIKNVHPGNQAEATYRITNNDPNESFSGTLTVGLRNAVEIPVDSNSPNGSGTYALADPGADHFPIAFADEIPPGLCIPLPKAPHLTTPPELTRLIDLLPGESMDITILSRPWGLCTSGSCSESTATLEGEFSDLSPGLACAGTVFATDTNAASTFGCQGSGRTSMVTVIDPVSPLAIFGALDSKGQPVGFQIDFATQLFNGSEVFNGSDYADTRDGYTLRLQQYFQGPFTSGMPLSAQAIMNFAGLTTPIQVRLEHLDLVSGAPTGLSNIAPFAVGEIGVDRDGDFLVDSFFDIFVQIDLVPISGTSFLSNDEINMEDFEIFKNSFESGNVSAWSYTVPNRSTNDIDGIQVYYTVRASYRETPVNYPCPPGGELADLNGDSFVDSSDLGIQLENWRTLGEPDADLDGSGRIDVLDMAALSNVLYCQTAF